MTSQMVPFYVITITKYVEIINQKSLIIGGVRGFLNVCAKEILTSSVELITSGSIV